MSYVELLAQMIYYTWVSVGIMMICIFFKEEIWWRLQKKYDRTRNPIKYDNNIKDFREWMINGYVGHGINLIRGEERLIIVGNTVQNCNILTSPPKYQSLHRTVRN